MSRPARILGRLGIGIAAAAFAALVGLPMLSLLVRVSPAEVAHHLGDPVVLAALGVSARTTLVSTALIIVLGLPIARLLAYAPFPGKRVVETIIELPIVLPPTVAGLALLLAFGRRGLVGGALSAFGISLPFTTLAVVVAQTFVAMPFFVTTATAGLRGVEHRYRDAAATLGASPGFAFRRVLLPLAFPSLLAGAAMAWARALGEFGATIMFAGSFPGRTETMPLAVYGALETDLASAIAVAIILLALSTGVLLAVRLKLADARHDAPRDAR